MSLLDRPLKALKRFTTGKYPAERTSIIVATPHKVGSTWLSSILADVYGVEPLPVSQRLRRDRLAVDVPLDELIPEFVRAKQLDSAARLGVPPWSFCRNYA
jgi:hypothetical protein